MKEIIDIKKTLYNKKEIVLKLKIKAGQEKNKIAGALSDGTLKLDIAAVPEKGKANQELIRFLAKEFDVARENVKIVSGASNKNKLIKITK